MLIQQARRVLAHLVQIIIAVVLVAILSGCVILAPIIQGFKETGVAEGDRQVLLSKDVKKFHEARYWGGSDALAYISEDKRVEIAQAIHKIQKDERMVDTVVDGSTFEKNSFKASVDVVIRYYKIPYYVVNSRTERQNWEFQVGSGWRLVSLEAVGKG